MERVLRPVRHAGPPGRRRVRRRAGGRLLSGAGAGDRHAPVPGHRPVGPVRAARAADRRQHRDRPQPRRDRRTRGPAAQRRHRHVRRQGPRGRAMRGLRPQHASAGRRSHVAGDPSAPGDRAAPPAHVLPADRRSQHRRHPRPRGPGALARRRARDPTGPVHPRGRGVRTDRSARLPGAARRLPHAQRVAHTGARLTCGHGQRQRLGPPDHGQRARRPRPRRPGRLRSEPEQPRPGDHREHADRESPGRQHGVAGAPRLSG